MKRLILAASLTALLTACHSSPKTETAEVTPPQPSYKTCWDGSTGPCPPQPAPVVVAPSPPQVTTHWDGTVTYHGAPASGYTVPVPQERNRDQFADYDPNPYKSVVQQPVSTFSADVDTASYSFVRQYVEEGNLPPSDSVRVEEMINYFDYDYKKPASDDEPFAASMSIVPTPWNPETKLLQIGLQGYEPPISKRPDMNLVFLIDVSGSMKAENKLPLLQKSFEILAKQLTRDDTISIVTYASQETVALKPTRGDKTDEILAAIRGLSAGGSTAGQAGMQMAYEQAAKKFKRNGTNRIILATDGDFNVGISDRDELMAYVSDRRDEDIYLSVLGFGQGNLKDDKMQAIAQNGNGIAAYIDSVREARKFFSSDMAKNLIPIANDLKLQVEFNPALVAEYRLIGYETRALNREDFSDDKVDAGDTGAGHAVTAIYEINPVGSKTAFVEPLRYTSEKPEASSDFNNEYGFLKVRYKRPGKDTSRLITMAISVEDEFDGIRSAPPSTRFATAVAAYGLKLREDSQLEAMDWGKVADLARSARGDDPYGLRSEFVELVRNIEAMN